MQPDPQGAPDPLDALLGPALADFRRAPGRHNPSAREPAILFENTKRILVLAAKGAIGEGALAANARFFVRTVLLGANSDHYLLLGCRRTDSPATIKEHYRLLMRLAHPDFALSRGVRWPADAAARINRAYDVLASPEKRIEYDSASRPQVAPMHPHPAAPTAKAAPRESSRVEVPVFAEGRRILKHLAWTFGGLGFGAGGLLIWLTDADRADDLMARAPARAIGMSSTEATPPAMAGVRPAQMPVDAAPVTPTPAAVSPRAAPKAEIAAVRRLPEPIPPAASTGYTSASAPAVPAASVALPEATRVRTEAGGEVLAKVAAVQPVEQPDPQAPTMTEVHPLLARLLQELEAGGGERIAGVLDMEARTKASTRSFIRHFETVTGGAKRVRIAQAQFSGRPAGSRIVVLGNLTLETPGGAAIALPLVVEAEFGRGPQGVTMFRLSSGN